MVIEPFNSRQTGLVNKATRMLIGEAGCQWLSEGRMDPGSIPISVALVKGTLRPGRKIVK
jgi:hypothetical protein